MDIEKSRFSIGKFIPNKNSDAEFINQAIAAIQQFTAEVEKLANNLSVEVLNWKYRPEGWTVKELVHHCADSHLNAIVRFKLALTEDKPTIKPCKEALWVQLADAQTDDIADSPTLLKALHNKWILLLRSLTKEDLSRACIHPEHDRTLSLATTIGLYAWHCNHHLAHIKIAINSEGIHK